MSVYDAKFTAYTHNILVYLADYFNAAPWIIQKHIRCGRARRAQLAVWKANVHPAAAIDLSRQTAEYEQYINQLPIAIHRWTFYPAFFPLILFRFVPVSPRFSFAFIHSDFYVIHDLSVNIVLCKLFFNFKLHILANSVKRLLIHIKILRLSGR